MWPHGEVTPCSVQAVTTELRIVRHGTSCHNVAQGIVRYGVAVSRVM
jgi:hypothetical protein